LLQMKLHIRILVPRKVGSALLMWYERLLFFVMLLRVRCPNLPPTCLFYALFAAFHTRLSKPFSWMRLSVAFECRDGSSVLRFPYSLSSPWQVNCVTSASTLMQI
jgi:hypothetical protein